jgi:hypothetical protein
MEGPSPPWSCTANYYKTYFKKKKKKSADGLWTLGQRLQANVDQNYLLLNLQSEKNSVNRRQHLFLK